DGGQLEVDREVCKGEHVILELVRLDVAHERKKAGLMIDHQHGSVVLVEAVVGLLHSLLLLGGGGSLRRQRTHADAISGKTPKLCLKATLFFQFSFDADQS